MRYHLISTAAVILSVQLTMAPAPAAAESTAELSARVEALQKQNESLRKENEALRRRQISREQPRVVTQPASAQPAPVRPDPGPYAAAVAVPAPTYKAVPPAGGGSWTGFYLGVNLGLSIGQSPTVRQSQFSNDPSVIADTFNQSPFGAVGGAQLGYNWQFAPNWVAGFETDLQGSGEAATDCISQCTVPAVTGFNRNLTIEQRLDWFGTARARLGWTNGPALIYATGGLAYGHVTTDVAFSDFNFGTPVSGSAHIETMKVGWTAGFGGEMQIAGNWTGKLEYLYVDLGNVSSGAFIAQFTPAVSETTRFDGAFRDHIVRFGVNYKFGEPVFASAAGGAYGMVTKAPPLRAYDWSGFHVGANLGIGIARNDTSTPFSTINNTTGTVGGVAFAEQFTLVPLGVVGGGQVGYDWQVARHWVVGAEADFQGTSQEDTACLNCGVIVGVGGGPIGTTLTQRIDWFGTLRGRVGWTDGPILYYATGGLAYGHIRTDERVDTIPLTTSVTTAASFGQTKVGWTAGAGAEAHLYGNWTAKAEYLYVDLGTVRGNVIAPELVIPPNINVLSENRGFSSGIHDHIFRLGVNYKLGPQ
jgi:outer membrane immunogenic protein